MMSGIVNLIMLIMAAIITFVLFLFMKRNTTKSQLTRTFTWNIILILIWIIPLIFQVLLTEKLHISPIVFEYFTYVGTCFLPVSLFFTSLVFANTKIKFKDAHLLLFIVPVISLCVLWTNNVHHLFYEIYSTNLEETVTGPYTIVHFIYTYGLFALALSIFLRYSIKNAGFFSRQSILILLGALIPIVVNILGTFNIIPMTIYITPICFTFTMFFFALAIFKFKFLSSTPIALQRIVDRMSDSYVVLDENNTVLDFNETFLKTFGLNATTTRNRDFIKLVQLSQSTLDELVLTLQKSRKSSKTFTFEKAFERLNKYFHVEVNSISNQGNFLGTLILFKDITQHIEDMNTIKENQNLLIERERLASLGQMIGGIAHNLKTPIMSISGAAEGLTDLVKEYDISIGDPEVTNQDHHDIAKDMYTWIGKIKEYTEYMSDVITAVKGQAVVMSEQDSYHFTVDELVKRVSILMRHELKNALVNLKTTIEIDKDTQLKGNVNSLVQVINNMISNSIQAYNGKTDENIEFTISKDNSHVILSIKDYAGGLPKEVADKLFKEMITTKGKNGTGLGLFMSYSNIRAHFNGNITVDTEEGVGSTFHIYLPIE